MSRREMGLVLDLDSSDRVHKHDFHRRPRNSKVVFGRSAFDGFGVAADPLRFLSKGNIDSPRGEWYANRSMDCNLFVIVQDQRDNVQ